MTVLEPVTKPPLAYTSARVKVTRFVRASQDRLYEEGEGRKAISTSRSAGLPER